METVFEVKILGRHHDRGQFFCGEPALDQYIRGFASQDMRRRMARVFVAVEQGSNRVAGYYSLSAASFRRADLPVEAARRLPRYPVPAAILGRLAVDRSWAGQSLGEFLLLDAFERVIRASGVMAVHAVIVDAIDARARSFYERYGFRRFPTTPLRLYLPVATIERARGARGSGGG